MQAVLSIAARVRRPVLLMVDTTELLYVFDDVAREDRARTAIGIGDWFVRDMLVRLLDVSPRLRVILAGQDRLTVMGLPDSAWQELELAAWSQDDVVDHFAALGLDLELARRAYMMSGGMPLIAAAIADLCQSGIGGGGAWLDQAVGQPMSAWLVDNILGRLSAEQRMLVQAACVLRVITEPALAHLVADTPLSGDWFTALARHQLLQAAPATNRAPRLVMHATIRGWLLEHLARADRDRIPDRRQLPRWHRAAAEFYAALAEGRLSAEEMYHRFAAEDAAPAKCRLWEQAILAAVTDGRLGDAYTLAHAAADAAAEPAQPSVLHPALALAFHAQAHIALLQGHLHQADRMAADADRHYQQVHDTCGQAQVAWMRGELAWRENRNEDAATFWRHSLNTAGGITEPADRADLALALALAVCSIGDLPTLHTAVDTARRLAADATAPAPHPTDTTDAATHRIPTIPLTITATAQVRPVTLLRLQATGAFLAGDYARADALITQGARLAHTVGEAGKHEQALLHALYASVALLRDDLHAAEEALKQGLETARNCPDTRCRINLLLRQSRLARKSAQFGPGLPTHPNPAPAAVQISLRAATEAAHQRALSERYAQAALDLALDLTDRASEADALDNLGYVALDRGDLNTAHQHHEQALALYQHTGNRLGQALALTNLGNVARERGDQETAEQHYQQALTLYQQAGSRFGQARTLDGLGALARDRGDLDNAEQHHSQGLALYQQIGDRSGQAATLGNLANVARDRGKPESAEQYFEQALALFQQVGNRSGQATALDHLGKLARDRGDLASAGRHHNQALALFQQIGDRSGQASALDNLGHVAEDREDLNAAMRYFEQSLTIERQIGDRSGQAHALNNLGHLAQVRAELGTAEQHHNEALALYRQTGSRPGVATALMGLGSVARSRRDLVTARQRYEQALTLYQQASNRSGQAAALNSLAMVSHDRADLNTARQLYEQALALYRQTGSRPGEQQVLRLISQLDGLAPPSFR
ncbi:tetratricopeptide repeat protein [Streptomyces sp. NPDC005931]|uniref:tetratricopeptide repeat protein n=1 Tax=Streptomyces sp. NPDC005931 TaxID=3364737 RepID=UPI0036C44AEB